MSGETWEARMAERARARRQPEPAEPHAGHTTHLCYPSVRCSCGDVVGVVGWAPTGHEVEQPCPMCGAAMLTSYTE